MSDVVIIHLDRPRELRFGHKALKLLEELTGMSILDVEDILANGKMSISLVEKFVYAGLQSDAKKNGETLTLDKVEELLDQAQNYQEIIRAVGRAFMAAFGVTGEVAEGNASQPAQGPEKSENTIGTKV